MNPIILRQMLQMDGNHTWMTWAQRAVEIKQQADAQAKESLIPASNWFAVALTTQVAVTALALPLHHRRTDTA